MKSPHGFFAAHVDGHQDFHGDAPATLTQIVNANHSTKGFAVNGAKRVALRVGNEDAHALLIEAILGGKVHAVARNIQSRENLIEVVANRVGWAHAYDLRQLQPGPTPSLGC